MADNRRMYRYHHVNERGKETSLLTVDQEVLKSNDLAEYNALMHARRLYDEGVESGKVVVVGYWAAQGFRKEISVAKCLGIHHKYEMLSSEPLPGWEEVCGIIDGLFRYDESGPMGQSYADFTVDHNRVQVRLEMPRNFVVHMTLDGTMIQGETPGVSEFQMVTEWQISPSRAKKIWFEVVKKTAALGKRYLK